MYKNLVLKKTKYLFLVLGILSFCISIAGYRFFKHDFVESATKKIIFNVLPKNIEIKTDEHHFVSFDRIVLTNLSVKSKGFEAFASTININNSLFSLIKVLLFHVSRLELDIFDANINIQADEEKSNQSPTITDRRDIQNILYSVIAEGKKKFADFSFIVNCSNADVFYQGGNIKANAKELSFDIDVEKNLKINRVDISLSKAEILDDSDKFKLSLSGLKNYDNSTGFIKRVEIVSDIFKLNREDLRFKFSFDKSVMFDFDYLNFQIGNYPSRIDNLKISLDMLSDVLAATLSTDHLEMTFSQKFVLDVKEMSVSSKLTPDNSDSNFKVDMNARARYDDKIIFQMPINLNLKSLREFIIPAVNFSSPYLAQPCSLESSFSNKVLDIGVHSDKNDDIDMKFKLDLNKNIIDATAAVKPAVFHTSSITLPFIDETQPINITFSSDFENSKVDLNWSGKFLEKPITINTSLNIDSQKIAIQGRGLGLGALNIRLPSEFNYSQKSLDFPVFYNDKQITIIQINSADGIVKFNAESKLLSIDGKYDTSARNKRIELVLSLLDKQYDFLCFPFKSGVNIYTDRLQAGIDWLRGVSIYFRALDFVLPDLSYFFRFNEDPDAPFGDEYLILNADFVLDINKNDKLISLNDSYFRLSNTDFSLNWNLDYDKDGFVFKNFLYASAELSISGGGRINGDFFRKDFYKTLVGNFSFLSSDGAVKADFRVQNQLESGLLKLNISFNRELFKFRHLGVECNVSTDWADDTLVSFKVDIVPESEVSEFGLEGRFKNKEIFFNIDQIVYGNLVADNLNGIINLNDMTANINFDGKYDYVRLDKSIPITFNPDISIKIEDEIKKISVADFNSWKKTVNLSLRNISLDYDAFEDISTQFATAGSSIEFQDGFLSGTLDYEKGCFDINILEPFPIQGSFNGEISKDRISVNSKIVHFPIAISRYFVFRPIFEITSGDFSGDILISGTINDINVDCFLHSNELKIWNFWTRNESITINNLNLVGNGKEIKLLRTTASSLNKTTGRISFFEFDAGISLDNIFEPFWYLDAYIPHSEKVEANIPIPSFNYNINISKTSGVISLVGRGMNNVDVFGDTFGSNAIFSSPMQAPDFVFGNGSGDGKLYVPNSEVRIKVKTGENVRIVYPDAKNPIISAVLKEGQDVVVVYSDGAGGNFLIEGKTEIESGEVNYMKRKFKIEKGDITWNSRKYFADKPLINLRASYRDYSFVGGVDIYIDVANATFDLNNPMFSGLKPVFSSSASLSDNEIFSRLGQLAIQTDTSNGNFQYLTSVSWDMFQLISSTSNFSQFDSFISFPDDIGLNLDLDVFSLQTNLLSNFVIDAAPSVLNQKTRNTGNAIARYLNGTSINIAKRMLPNIIFSFSAEFLNSAEMELSYKRGLALGGDLVCLMTLRTECRLEPFDITVFLQPVDFSIAGFLAGYGLTISKSIVI